jgi:hypothetical protein
MSLMLGLLRGLVASNFLALLNRFEDFFAFMAIPFFLKPLGRDVVLYDNFFPTTRSWFASSSKPIPGSDRKSCNRSCEKFQIPCKVPPSAHRPAGEPQIAVSHPLPNTPSKASLSAQKGESVNLCVRYDLLPMSQVVQLPINTRRFSY